MNRILAKGNDAVVSLHDGKVRKEYCVSADHGNAPLPLELLYQYQRVISEINAEF